LAHNYGDPPEKFDPSLLAFQGYQKVIGTDKDRLTTYDFLFIHLFCSVLLSFRVTIVTLYSALEVTLCYLRHSINWLFYITLLAYVVSFSK